MRLYEQLLASRGGLTDTMTCGAVSELSKLLVKAECFVLTENVAIACSEVSRSRPSSILSAIDLIRAPYPYTWIEWQPSDRHYNRDNGKTIPTWVGMMVETDRNGSRGRGILAWAHKGDVEVCPFGLVFDWSSELSEPVLRRYNVPEDIIQEREAQLNNRAEFNTAPSRWAHLKGDEFEFEAYKSLCRHSEILPVDFCSEFIHRYDLMPSRSAMARSFIDDVSGELPFVESFFLLLNSRNSVLEQQRENLVRLNKKRAKAKKTPLKEFITTRMRLSRVQQNKANAMGFDREAARRHMVRGHFKVRSSGVYWWGAHMRGGRQNFVLRREYVA